MKPTPHLRFIRRSKTSGTKHILQQLWSDGCHENDVWQDVPLYVDPPTEERSSTALMASEIPPSAKLFDRIIGGLQLLLLHFHDRDGHSPIFCSGGSVCVEPPDMKMSQETLDALRRWGWEQRSERDPSLADLVGADWVWFPPEE